MRFFYILLFILSPCLVYCQANNIVYSTVEIKGLNKKTTGTAFFFLYDIDSFKVPVIVTNKHVVQNLSKAEITFKELIEGGSPSDYSKIQTRTYQFDSFYNRWTYDKQLDLAIMPIYDIMQFNIKQFGRHLFTPFFLESQVLPDSILSKLPPIQNVFMVGYPVGLADTIKNLPITRKGITATHPFFNYNGNPEFLVDMAVFDGSSGSPVFIYGRSDEIWQDGSIGLGGLSVILLGICSNNYVIEKNNQSLNLGAVIHASKLLDFKSEIYKNHNHGQQ